MAFPIQLISTDFDGTLFAEFENPPVPPAVQSLIAHAQSQGASWVINTGRDLSSVLETLGRAHLTVRPDFIAVVEREIYYHENHRYVGLEEWNQACTRSHASLFEQVRQDIPRMVDWISTHFDAEIYEDDFSPFCLIAENNEDADKIVAYLDEYCRRIPHLAVMRNDIYARLCHAAYNKGSALGEITRRLGLTAHSVLAAGDHYNDLPMLSNTFARWLVAPANAIPEVKETVLRQSGYVSSQPYGHGVARGIEYFLEQVGALPSTHSSGSLKSR
ncbi:MAG: HAD family hydrolase [Verrucomicrobiota bacterium]